MLEKINKLKSWQSALIITLIGIAVYFDGLKNQFIGDDQSQIVNNPPVHSISHIVLFFEGGTFYIGKGIAPLYGVYFRPLMTTVFSLIYTIFGAQPFYYHLFQLILCIGSTIILYLFFRFSFKPALSLFLSLIFLVHPINSEVVFAIPCMQDALFFFFGILALYLLLRFKSTKSLLLVAVCLFFSLLAKETGLLFLIMAIIYLYWWERRRLLKFISIMAIPLVLYLILRVNAIGLFRHPTIAPIDNLDLKERLFTSPSIVLFFITKLLFPWKLASAYYWVYQRFSFGHFLIPLFIDLAAFSVVIYVGILIKTKATKAHFYTYIFFALWTAVGLLTTLQVIALDMTASQTWFYFSMAGVLGMMGTVFTVFPIRIRQVWLLIVGIILVGSLGTRTIIWGFDWKNADTLASHDITVSTDDYNAYDTLATEQLNQGNFNKAHEYIDKSISIYPTFNNYATLGGILANQRQYSEAVSIYDKGLQYGSDMLIYNSLGELTLVYGGYSSGLQYFGSTLQLFPQDSILWTYLAVFEARYGNTQASKAAISKAAMYGQVSTELYDNIINGQPFSLDLPGLGGASINVQY